MADRVVVLAEGRILQQGTPQQVYAQPVDRFVASFVGQANLWDGRVLDATHVETPLGVLMCTPTQRATGSAVTVMLRPEAVRAGAAPDGRNQVRGEVLRDRFLGAVRRIDLRVGAADLRFEGQPSSDLLFHLPPASLHLLDRAPARGPV